MRKTILSLLFVVLTTTAITAQDRDRDRDQDRDQIRLQLVDGDVLQIRDRDQIRLRDKITLNDGTVVNPDGTYLKNQERLRLRDGECLDADGVKYANEYQYRARINKENQGLSQAQIQARNQNRFHIMAVDGEMLQIRNQSQERLNTSMTLENGTVVNPDGTYQLRDRKQLQLKDGECLNMDGQLFKNSLQNRKMLVKKNKKANKQMMNKKVQKKPAVQKKNVKKGVNR